MNIRINDEISLLTLKGISEKYSDLAGKVRLFNLNSKGAIRSSIELNNGKLHGHFVENYENGQRRSRYQFYNGLVQGSCTQWEENGEVMLISNFHLGNPHGRQYMYGEGRVDQVEVWENGTCHITIYKDGTEKLHTRKETQLSAQL